MSAERPQAITKQLSRNDTGETGAHQAGIVIPREPAILSFFPPLDPKQYNPRHALTFEDAMSTKWIFSFIYYNNRFFGGTRNEYRLTCMTPYIRAQNLHAGDSIVLSRDGDLRYQIRCKRLNDVKAGERLKLGTSWHVVAIKRA